MLLGDCLLFGATVETAVSQRHKKEPDFSICIHMHISTGKGWLLLPGEERESKTPKPQYLIWQWGWKKSQMRQKRMLLSLSRSGFFHFFCLFIHEKNTAAAQPGLRVNKKNNNLNSTWHFVIRRGNVLRFRCRISLSIGCPHFDLPASYLPACTKAERLNLPREGTRRDKRGLHRDAYCPAIIPPPQAGRKRRRMRRRRNWIWNGLKLRQ